LPSVHPVSVHSYSFSEDVSIVQQMKGSVKEPNKFHNYEAEKITRKASDAAEYIELFGSSTPDRHARSVNVIL